MARQRWTTSPCCSPPSPKCSRSMPRRGSQEPIEGFFCGRTWFREYYLINRLQKATKRFKLLHLPIRSHHLERSGGRTAGAHYRRKPSIAITDNPRPSSSSSCARPPTDLSVVCRGISKLLVVVWPSPGIQDNPQLNFESIELNARRALPGDLIPQLLLMGQTS